MFIPYSTDAPLYHRPIATCTLIGVNVAVFVGLIAIGSSYANDSHLARDLCLTFGFSFRPWQWVTSTFMHADVVHLLGNMLCLWSFGVIVEGKIGWARFLPLYIGMGVVHCLLQQGLMLFADQGCSLGASGVIFALMAIAMVWAPQNEMSCVTFIYFRPFFYEMSVLSLVALMLGLQVLTQMFVGIEMTSQALHLLGAAVGLPVGIVMLNKGWVDCEGWDLISVYTGRPSDRDRIRDEEEKAARKLLEEVDRMRMESAANQQATAASAPYGVVSQSIMPTTAPVSVDDLTIDTEAPLEPIRRAIASGDAILAFSAYEELANDPLTWELPERELTQIIRLFHRRKQWSESISAMAYYVQHFCKHEVAVRLKLAQVLIDIEKRPRQALYVLDKMTTSPSTEAQVEMLAKLRRKAERATTSIPSEPLPDEW